LPQKYRSLTIAGIDATVRAAVDPSKLLFVVVGDAAKVRPQLDVAGLPVETMLLPTMPDTGAE
jgi:zinc protease